MAKKSEQPEIIPEKRPEADGIRGRSITVEMRHSVLDSAMSVMKLV